MEQAEVADRLQAIGQDRLEEATEKLDGVERGRTAAGTAPFPGGEGDRAVLERDEAAVGDGDREAIRGEGGAGGVAVGVGLTVDVPGDGPDLGGDGLQQSGVAHGFFAERTGDGGERCDRHKAVGAGGQPCRAVSERPPPGTRSWRCGWDGNGLPQGCRTPVHPGRSVPMQRSSWASRLRAVAEACHMAWEAGR